MTNLKNLGSLITVTGKDGHEHCLGYLIDFKGHGIFSPDGKVEITKEQMDAHNKALADAEIAGLVECKVGQYGTLYLINGKVQNFLGTVIADKVKFSPSLKQITFFFAGKTFRGWRQKDADCFNFKRIA
jgi:hypothetical protein